MGVTIDFSEDLYRLLGVETAAEPGHLYEYPEWDLLREIDRRERQNAHRSGKLKDTREYMRAHPDRIAKLKKKVSSATITKKPDGK